jgi:hypothetical protein
MQVTQHLPHQPFAQLAVLDGCQPLTKPDAPVAALACPRVELEAQTMSTSVLPYALYEVPAVQDTVSDIYVRLAIADIP